MTPGVVYFIGAGPGDPELLTVKGQRLIQTADLVVWADSLVHPGVAGLARADATVIGSSSLTLEQITATLVAASQAGQTIARVQSGDPSLYGAIHEQQVLLERAGVPYEIVPGVSSAFAAAARLDAELTVPDVAQTVIFTRVANRTTTVPPGERLSELARHGTTLVIFLSASVIEKVVEELRAGGLPADTPVAVVYRATWADEQVLRGTLSTIAPAMRAARITKQALILVGPAIDPALRQRATAASRSHLYRPDYTHLFRKGGPATTDPSAAGRP
jgi:precorrin-4/cobalt-precorrin-4 C11-methyltransferase